MNKMAFGQSIGDTFSRIVLSTVSLHRFYLPNSQSIRSVQQEKDIEHSKYMIH